VLSRLDTTVDDVARVELILLLEQLKAAAAATQAEVIAAFAARARGAGCRRRARQGPRHGRREPGRHGQARVTGPLRHGGALPAVLDTA
jgi:hypothetical protein